MRSSFPISFFFQFLFFKLPHAIAVRQKGLTGLACKAFMKERDVARHALFPYFLSSAFGAFLLAIGWPLTPRRYSPLVKWNGILLIGLIAGPSLKLLPTIYCVRFSQQSSILRRRCFTKRLHLVNIRCIATIGFRYHDSFRTASNDSMNQWIVCPKLRVSPLNAQTEFKGFSMQTILGFNRQKQLVINIVRYSDSYCFPCIPPTPRLGHCLPPSLTIQVGVPSYVSLSQPFGRSVLHLRLQFSYQRLVFTISIVISI